MKTVFTFLFLITVLFSQERVTLATLDWPPYVLKNTPTHGFITEIVQAILKEAHVNSSVHFMPWSRVLKSVEVSEYDIAYPAYYSSEREKTYLYTESFAEGPLVFLKKRNNKIDFSGDLNELKKYKIGIVRGYVNTQEFDNASYLQKFTANSDIQNIRLVLHGRLDLAVIDKYTALDLIEKNYKENKNELDFVATPLEIKKLYLIVSKQNPQGKQIISSFNNGLKSAHKKNIIKNILRNYGFTEQ